MFLFSFAGWFTRLVAVAVRLPVGDAVLLRHVPRVGQNIWYNVENIYTNNKILDSIRINLTGTPAAASYAEFLS